MQFSLAIPPLIDDGPTKPPIIFIPCSAGHMSPLTHPAEVGAHVAEHLADAMAAEAEV